MKCQTSIRRTFSIKRLFRRGIKVIALVFMCFSLNAQSSFVRVDSTQFTLEGSSYQYIGFNFWSAMHLACAKTGDRKRLIRELDQLQSLGITNLRIMVASEGPDSASYRMTPALQLSPGKYNPDLLEALDFLLLEMSKRKMYAVLCLGNSWQWSGGFAQYVAWSKGKDIPYPLKEDDYDDFMKFTAQFYKDKKTRQWYLEFVRFMVSRVNSLSAKAYKDDPTIMSWELANEPYAFHRKQYVQWIKETSALIKSIDSNHLVTVGSEGMTNYPKYTKNDVYKDFEFDDIDYITIHTWPENWNWYDPKNAETELQNAINKTKDYLHTHLATAYKLNKPLVLEEFGLARDQGSCEERAKLKCRDQYFAAIFELFEYYQTRNTPWVGLNLWAWAGEGRPREAGKFWKKGDSYTGDPPHEPQGWYSIYDSDKSTLELISRFNKNISRSR